MAECIKVSDVLLMAFSHNEIEELPGCIGAVHKLQVLLVQHNRLRDITPGVTRLGHLEELVRSLCWN